MKSIPIALQDHLDQDATTWCLLFRVACKSGPILGFTSLDVDVTYDDGNGEIVYHAENGFTIERLQASADMAVDNTNLQGWLSEEGITEQDIRAGLFDFAGIRIYRVNYLNLSQGHEIVAAGTAGETKFSQNGWRTEFRSLTQQLKQTVSKLYSLTCRTKFGSQYPSSGAGEQPEDPHPCTKEWVWVNGTVTAVGAETDRIFTDTGITQPDHHFDIGVVQWLSGSNAGNEMEVDSQVADVFSLAIPMPYPIQVGDTYRVRQDCDKSFAMCRDVHNNAVNFRGEHLIPIADGGSNLVPGAQIARS